MTIFCFIYFFPSELYLGQVSFWRRSVDCTVRIYDKQTPSNAHVSFYLYTDQGNTDAGQFIS